MPLTYFRRYRMELGLGDVDLSLREVSPPYRFVPWDASLLESHAETKFLSFREEIDANVFPCFTELAGCRRLMRDIARKEGFLPEATWLALYRAPGSQRDEPCGTIQGVRDHEGFGSIQNLGIVPMHRGRRLGTHLLFRALAGFRGAGIARVHLEVTADNDGAIRLYGRLGFHKARTVFKAAEVGCSY